MQNSQFIYFIINPESKNLLKEEIGYYFPNLNFSFSSSCFISYKITSPFKTAPAFLFALHWGYFQKKDTYEVLLSDLKMINGIKVSYELPLLTPTKIEGCKLFDEVYEVIKIDNNNSILGKFKIKNIRDTFLSGIPPLELPEQSPSRAYLKINEAQIITETSFLEGQIALEIGSAPGGASFYLLSNGLKVFGVDPGEMSEQCLKNKNFTHLRKSIQSISSSEIEKINFHWLLVDVNLSPEVTIKELERVLKNLPENFLGAFITLKMTKLISVQRLDFYTKLLKKIGLNPKLQIHISSNKKEFLIFADKS